MIEAPTAGERITDAPERFSPGVVAPLAKAKRSAPSRMGQCPHRRTISRDLLAAMERSHPLEAALANLLIKEGTWALAD